MEQRPKRATYHHGDLRAALVDAGVELARAGGPTAVVLREVARVVGVAPNSAYGHFKTLGALKRAVAQRALREMAAVMIAQLDAFEEPADPVEAAKAHLCEVGRAYVRFALDEPGLFATAMGGDPAGTKTPGFVEDPADPTYEDRPKPDSVVLGALHRLTEVGCLAPGRVEAAVMACWATVHGLAGILLTLQPDLPEAARNAAVDSSLEVLVLGLTSLDRQP
ncbi:TetR/AcrR family transcriptional regulator [Umezawaea endophytica]|uniref:WHG domain-containing protein n=1 Tax=Umezawaea endophytica TaxID=1654476 RepID=A0A9X2VVK3_9PSEU|nr:TetR/AcrR family transcriptional regulator [Umezawaea endophytica]MCS7483499.1 WHG domain-containing protein [Umezawaea endophytica]